MIELGRGIRGAAAGAAAAAVWAAQQPLDKRAFGSRHDDLELLGKLVTRGRAWPAAGLTLHLLNGGLFGFVYALAAARVPGPGPARGLAAGMVEHFGLWPLGRVVDRLHPARRELPRLTGNRRALWQETWRHALFGVLLGVLEERLNEPGAGPERRRRSGRRRRSVEVPVGSNGHGDIEAAAGAGLAA